MQPPLGQDQARRTRRYLIQMGIRLLCFLGAIAVGPVWLKFVLIAAAVVLPYIAVLGANAGRDQSHYDSSPMEHRALPSAATGPDRTIMPDADRPPADDRRPPDDASPGGRA